MFVDRVIRILRDMWLRLTALRGPVWLRPVIVAAFCGGLAWLQSGTPGKSSDFTVFWAAAQHAFGPVYDVDFISAAQAGIAPPGARPFQYPPSFLLAILPLALAPYRAAYVIWSGLTAALFVEAGGRMTRWPWLAIFSPVFLFTVLIGQTTLLVGALLMAGLTLSRRPVLAGVLLGVAAALKPQAALLVPVMLAFTGQWRSLLAAGLSALALCAASAGVFGAQAWIDWLAGLRGFVGVNDRLHIARLSPADPALKVALGALSILGIAVAARRRDPPTLILATLGGTLLISPHAPFYEVTLLLPAALAIVWAGGWRIAGALMLLIGWAAGSITLALALAMILFLPPHWRLRLRPLPAAGA